MDTIDTTSSGDCTEAHNHMDEIFTSIRDKVSEAMLNEHCEGRPITREKVLAQIIMEEMFANPCDPENESGAAALTTDNKKCLLEMASHMGPDWAQALYHAAVFITKVA